jgi:hypothetical protein
MSFAHQFRQHVTPRLRAVAERQAFFMACDSQDWSEAYQAVMDEALRYGATHLPNDTFVELSDWIGATLIAEITAAEQRCTEMHTANADKCQSDPVSYYTDLAAGCSKPDAMQWVFAAINPEYRAHLLAVKRAK